MLVGVAGLRERRGDLRGAVRAEDRGELVREGGRERRQGAPRVELLERHGVRGGAALQAVGQESSNYEAFLWSFCVLSTLMGQK